MYIADLASDKEVSTLVKRVLDDGHDIDILVTSAGIQRRHPSHLFPKADWDEVCFLARISLHLPPLSLPYLASNPFILRLFRTIY